MIGFQFIREGDLLNGIRKLGDSYEWHIFLVAFLSSAVGMFIYSIVEIYIFKNKMVESVSEKSGKQPLLSQVTSPPQALV